MDFDVFFSKKDKLDAVNAAKAMIFLPENCYFIEDRDGSGNLNNSYK